MECLTPLQLAVVPRGEPTELNLMSLFSGSLFSGKSPASQPEVPSPAALQETAGEVDATASVDVVTPPFGETGAVGGGGTATAAPAVATEEIDAVRALRSAFDLPSPGSESPASDMPAASPTPPRASNGITSMVEPELPAIDETLAAESGLTSLLADVGLVKSAGDAMQPKAEQSVEVADVFQPQCPKSLRHTGLPRDLIEGLVLKFLLNRGAASGREISEQTCLPFRVVDEFLRELKADQLIGHRCASGSNDYIWEMSVEGFERARRQSEVTTYFGAAPVTLKQYFESVEQQALKSQVPSPADLDAALADLTLPEKMMQQIGQAVRAAKAMFLFGSPGNGKTSIAQRISASYGEDIWIPRSLYIDGEIVRLFDPVMHEPLPIPQNMEVDHRWIRVKRPTIIAGGELTLDNLEMTTVGETRVIEAPLQLKSNCGILVIDDFGRQRCSATDLLNRWIVPLETQFDFLNMPSGKKVRVPFEQMVVFSTNLAPQQLVDEAFLRRIPYKVEAVDPSKEEFKRVFIILAEKMAVHFDEEVFERMIKRHYIPQERGLRYCHARDLLSQIKTMCEFEGRPCVMNDETVDRAVENYFVNYGDDVDFGACANV